MDIEEMKKYQIIYADPPWKFGSRLRNGTKNKQHGVGRLDVDVVNYDTMTIKEICDIPIKNIADNNCILFIWSTDAHLEECMKVINAWGFKYKTIAFNWLKKNKDGTQKYYYGHWTVKSGEMCLLATKGTSHKLLIKHNIRQLVESRREEHSKKPKEVRNRIFEMFGDILRIELFAREKTEGWDVWGNEVENDIDIQQALKEG